MGNLMDFISKDMQAYMEENGLCFTDFEKATLIYNSHLPVKERFYRLEKLLAETDDEKLKEQIPYEIDIFKADMSVFGENRGGYVYAVKSYEFLDEPYVDGYFASLRLAYDYAVGKNYRFDIEKHRIIGFSGVLANGMMLSEDTVEPVKGKIYTNPYLFETGEDDIRQDADFLNSDNYRDCRDFKKFIEEVDSLDRPAAVAHYSEKGELVDFYSAEIERDDKDELEHSFSPELFKNAFIYMPNPFECGDIVRTIADKTSHGLISESRESVDKYYEKVRRGVFKPVDFFDTGMKVDFIQDDGYICHSHINPAFMEKYEPEESDDDCKLLTAGRGLLKGEAVLDWFLDCYENLKKKRNHKNN
jgi:hypothetical protein